MSTSRPSSPPHHVSRAQDPAHAEHESRVPTPHRTALASAVFSPVPFLGGSLWQGVFARSLWGTAAARGAPRGVASAVSRPCSPGPRPMAAAPRWCAREVTCLRRGDCPWELQTRTRVRQTGLHDFHTLTGTVTKGPGCLPSCGGGGASCPAALSLAFPPPRSAQCPRALFWSTPSTASAS